MRKHVASKVTENLTTCSGQFFGKISVALIFLSAVSFSLVPFSARNKQINLYQLYLY